MNDFNEYMNEPEHIDEPKAPIKPIYIFFSHPMNGISYDKLVDRREFFLDYICSLLLFKGEFKESQVDRIQLIENLNHEELDADAGRLMHLGRSIQQMQDADCVIFDYDYENSKGCRVEESVCNSYNIMHLNLDPSFDARFIAWFSHKCQS